MAEDKKEKFAVKPEALKKFLAKNKKSSKKEIKKAFESLGLLDQENQIEKKSLN